MFHLNSKLTGNATASSAFMGGFSEQQICSRKSKEIKTVAKCAQTCGMERKDCKLDGDRCVCKSTSSGSIKPVVAQEKKVHLRKPVTVTMTSKPTEAQKQVASIANADGALSTTSEHQPQSERSGILAQCLAGGGSALVVAAVLLVVRARGSESNQVSAFAETPAVTVACL